MNKGVLAGIVIALIAAVGLLVISQTSSSGSSKGALCDAIPTAATGLTNDNVTTLKTEDQSVGTGDLAVAGKSITMNYVGRLVDGTQFDTSCGKGNPFQFTLGGRQVIAGWDQGIVGMQVGGKRRLIIPASLGYGAAGAGGVIPPNAALVFDVELVAVQR